MNIGVAAHIYAASPGGPRFRDDMSPEQRSNITNGIWLCQNHAKLVDSDDALFPASKLEAWKETAEHIAALEAQGFSVSRKNKFAEIEKKAPAIVEEMRADLLKQPLVREFVLLPSDRVSYSASYPQFHYFRDAHPYLMPVMTIMQNLGAIRDARFNDVPRYQFTEEFVSFLIGDG